MRSRGSTYQSSGHGGLVILRKMLLQGQNDAVGNDGGQDHVLKWRGKVELRNKFSREGHSLQDGHAHKHTSSINPHCVCAVCVIFICKQAGRTEDGP